MAGIETIKTDAGTVIFKEGDKPNGVYFILTGGVEISHNKGGQKFTLATMGPDSVFGEMALIDNQIRSATVIAAEDTECMLGTAGNFSALIDNLDPTLKAAIKQVVLTIREKNNYAKEKMSPAEIAAFSAVKRKIEQLKIRILGNPPLMKKINSLDPFLNSVFHSLIRLL